MLNHPQTRARRIALNTAYKKKKEKDFFGRITETIDKYKPKPINCVYCPQCKKEKLQFKTFKKAKLYLDYNAEKVATINGNKPIRVYWCNACCCYHITSKPKAEKYKD